MARPRRALCRAASPRNRARRARRHSSANAPADLIKAAVAAIARSPSHHAPEPAAPRHREPGLRVQLLLQQPRKSQTICRKLGFGGGGRVLTPAGQSIRLALINCFGHSVTISPGSLHVSSYSSATVRGEAPARRLVSAQPEVLVKGRPCDGFRIPDRAAHFPPDRPFPLPPRHRPARDVRPAPPPTTGSAHDGRLPLSHPGTLAQFPGNNDLDATKGRMFWATGRSAQSKEVP